MKSAVRSLPVLALAAAFAFLIAFGLYRRYPAVGAVVVHRAAAFGRSPPLASLRGSRSAEAPGCRGDCGMSPGEPDEDDQAAIGPTPAPRPVSAAAAAEEQKSPGFRPAVPAIESFDGLGV